MTTVLIADDQPLQRLGFRMLLQGTPGLTPAGEAEHGAEAVRLAAQLRPDVVLMDIRMPGMDGLEATRRIVASGGRTRVLIVTTFDLDEYAYEGLRVRRQRLPPQGRPPRGTRRRYPRGRHRRRRRRPQPHPAAPRRLRSSGPRPERHPLPADPRLQSLSDREHEVLVAIGQGWTNAEIAERLVLTESTVKKHVGRVLAKIGARDRIQAVIMAYDAGLVRAKP